MMAFSSGLRVPTISARREREKERGSERGRSRWATEHMREGESLLQVEATAQLRLHGGTILPRSAMLMNAPEHRTKTVAYKTPCQLGFCSAGASNKTQNRAAGPEVCCPPQSLAVICSSPLYCPLHQLISASLPFPTAGFSLREKVKKSARAGSLWG